MNSESLAETQEIILEFLTTLARHISGDVTLNQIRVLQFINLCSRYRGEATSNVKVCSELDLPSATVSRAIVKFIEAGLISDEVDPDDGRGRLVVGTGVIPGTNQHLDPELAEDALELLVSCTNRRDDTLIVNLHQPRLARMFATRVLGLHEGKVVFDGPPDALSATDEEFIYAGAVEEAVSAPKREAVR